MLLNVYVCGYIHESAAPRKSRRGHQIPWGFTGCSGPPDLGSGNQPIEEQQAFLITESSLQPHDSGFDTCFSPDFELNTEYIITLLYRKDRRMNVFKASAYFACC